MQLQTLRQEVMESLKHLPNNADIDEIMYRLYVVDKLRKSRDAIKKGLTVNHENLKRTIEQG
ncbi:MAG: hypothetical protein NTX45_10850 [Proteobacteria bacterium]|nr:hypothetical protein [Pseudomonadota bacterium]